VATTGSAFALPRGTDVPKFWIWPVALICTVLLCILLFFKVKTAPARLAYAAMILGATLFAIAGCGGGGTSGATPKTRTATPKGTTTLTVTAQSGTLPSQTLQLTLTVN